MFKLLTELMVRLRMQNSKDLSLTQVLYIYSGDLKEYVNEPVFESVNSDKKHRYYVGNIAQYSNRACLTANSFLESQQCDMKLAQIDRNTCCKSIILSNNLENIENKYFWPRKVYWRRWFKTVPSKSGNLCYIRHTIVNRKNNRSRLSRKPILWTLRKV